MVVKVDTKSDLRRYSSPHRATKRWKELYNERTSVERCNSRMEAHLTADAAMQIWGIQKVITYQYLNAIVLLASALTMVRQSGKVAA
ncbi:transposase [Paenibacillus odorifer]|nr:transposase [Paenibacillus odorifer]